MRRFKLLHFRRLSFFMIPALLLLFAGQLIAGQVGEKKWSFDTGRFIFAPPAIGEENILYVASGDDLYAIQPDGTMKWSFDTGVDLRGPPLLPLTVRFTSGTARTGR